MVADASPNNSSGFREFKVYDQARPSPDWTSLLSPTQFAVFFKDLETGAPLSADGAPVSRIADCIFMLFDRLDDARLFCEARVAEHPSMCCEIFDREGKAKPPLLTIVHPSMEQKDALGPTWSRRRKLTAILCFLVAIPLFVWDAKAGWGLILPSFIAFNLIFFGLRFLYWNTARRSHDQAQARRIEDHLRRKKDSGNETSNEPSKETSQEQNNDSSSRPT